MHHDRGPLAFFYRRSFFPMMWTSRWSFIAKISGRVAKNISSEPLTSVRAFRYHSPCMAMLLVVATTEATDPTRVSVSFRTTANVSEFSSLRLRGETRGVAEEVRVGEIVNHVSPNADTNKPMEPRVRITSRRR